MVDLPGDVALEDAHDLSFGFALRGAARHVDLGGRIVMTRMSCHAPTKVYVARRTAEGKSKREIMRILKRYVAREVYHYLPRD